MDGTVSYEVKDFQQQVIEASRNKPVLVDFWADWCGPCKTLGPVLEKLAGETDAWDFVKVDVDANRELAGGYQIRSIPAVKLFVDGVVVEEFAGALPEGQIRDWLDRALPSEADVLVSQAAGLADAGDDAAARALLEKILATTPDHAGARLALARQVLSEDPARAAELVAPIGLGSPLFQSAENIRVTAQALASAATAPESPARADYLRAVEALGKGALHGSIQRRLQAAPVLPHLLGIVELVEQRHTEFARCLVQIGFVTSHRIDEIGNRNKSLI